MIYKRTWQCWNCAYFKKETELISSFEDGSKKFISNWNCCHTVPDGYGGEVYDHLELFQEFWKEPKSKIFEEREKERQESWYNNPCDIIANCKDFKQLQYKQLELF